VHELAYADAAPAQIDQHVRHDLAGLARERDRLDNNAAALGRLLLSPLGSFLQ
jgi:hypothetical protein